MLRLKQKEAIPGGTQIEIWDQASEVETTKQINSTSRSRRNSPTYLKLLLLKSRLLQIKTPESEALQKKIGI